MMKEAAALEALAHALAAKVRNRGRPPDCSSPEASSSNNDPHATTSAYIRRIRMLTDAFQLNWLVDQHLLTRQSIADLSLTELRALLIELEEAREAITEGVPLEHTGLIKNMASLLPEC
jgi:hypothetical protein